MNLYLGLIHHPVKNKQGELVATSVTNLDIHDIARSCRTFGVKKYFIVTPLRAQHDLVGRILGHWNKSGVCSAHPDRGEALGLAYLAMDLDEACRAIEAEEGAYPRLVATGANLKSFDHSCRSMAHKMHLDEAPYFLLFGTGWGLHSSLIERSDFTLRPISGRMPGDYNHLSVRSAVAIYLDRLTTGEAVNKEYNSQPDDQL